MKLLKLKENKSIKEYEKEWETQKGYKTCDNCGTRLNDGGTCPKCDDGEETMDESLRESSEEYATKKVTPCCICKQPIEGYGNNAEPVCKGRCCDKCNREKVIPARIDKFRGGLTESYNKIDEDTANEIALMAMSALSLKEHEAQALEYDLIEGNAGKWIKDFEALPDNSDVKKLFFTFVKKSTNESYDPKDFNIDARTPFDDEMEKIYKPLATAIKEERWEDAAKEYWELKNEFDAELQSVSKKPIIGKLFKLMSIPHNNALNNYKKSIPAEYLNRKGKKNEDFNESVEFNFNNAASSGNWPYKMSIQTYVDVKDSIAQKIDELDQSAVFAVARDATAKGLDIDGERLYYSPDSTVENISPDNITILKDIVIKYAELNEAVVNKFYIDEIVSAQGGKTTTERHSFDTLEELKQYVKDANLTPEDIKSCGKCEIKDLFEGCGINESLGVGAGLSLGGAAIGADIAGSSLKKSDSKVKKDYDDDFDLTVY